MKIGPKYKIAKRLGAPVFEKTQTQKFAASEAKKSARTRGRRPGAMSDYKRQLLEKQKMRYTYGLSEKQLRRYVNTAMEYSHQPINQLFQRLEYRLDNVVYRLGLAKTRQMSRQMVSHGHICVNNRRLNVPSHKVSVNDVISVREGSKKAILFENLDERHESASIPHWLTFDIKKLTGTVTGQPIYQPTESLFDPEQVMEYYSR